MQKSTQEKKKETTLITIQLHCNAPTAVIHSTYGCSAEKQKQKYKNKKMNCEIKNKQRKSRKK
jgi:hypothetical protein